MKYEIRVRENHHGKGYDNAFYAEVIYNTPVSEDVVMPQVIHTTQGRTLGQIQEKCLKAIEKHKTGQITGLKPINRFPQY